MEKGKNSETAARLISNPLISARTVVQKWPTIIVVNVYNKSGYVSVMLLLWKGTKWHIFHQNIVTRELTPVSA